MLLDSIIIYTQNNLPGLVSAVIPSAWVPSGPGSALVLFYLGSLNHNNFKLEYQYSDPFCLVYTIVCTNKILIPFNLNIDLKQI